MDDQIQVQLIASIDQLRSEMNNAVSVIQGTADKITDGFKGASESAEGFGSGLRTALNLGIFLEMEQVASQAMNGVREAFEMTIGKAEEFGLSNAKFARVIGTTADEAAGLSQSLEGVGVSTESYENMALRLGQRMGAQEAQFKSLGVATRDSSDKLLGGKAAMDAVFEAMQKNPAQENAIAWEAFGRRAVVAFDIMRAGNEDVQTNLGLMQAMGVQTGDTSTASADLERNLNQLRVMWDSVWIALGQRLMPVVDEFVKYIEGPGQGGLHAFGAVLVFTADIVVGLGTAFLETGTIIGGVVAEAVDILGGLGRAIYDGLTGNWSAIKGDVTATWHDMESTFQKTIESMKAEAAGGQAVIDALAGKGNQLAAEKSGAYGQLGGGVQGNAPPAKKDDSAQKMQDEKLQAAEKEALEEVTIEKQKNESLLALGKETLAAYTAEEEKEENERYGIQKHYLEQRAIADKGNVVAHQRDLDELAELEIAHQAAVDKIHQTAAEKQRQLDDQAIAESIQANNDQLKDQIATVEEEYKTHQISAEQRANSERTLTQVILGESLKQLDAEMSTLQKGTAAWNAAYKQRMQVAQQMTKGVEQINNQLAEQEQQKWTTLGNSIRSSFNSSLNGMILGTESWKQAVGSLINGVASAFLDMGEKILEDWIEQMIMREVLGNSTQESMQVATVTSNAEIAASGAMAAISAIPYVGPFIAPEVAAATLSGTMAFAAQGMELDQDRLVFAHKDEQVLPADLSRGFRSMIKNGGQSGDINLNYNPTVHGEQKSFSEQLEENSDNMIAFLYARQRDGSLKLGG
jgi:hypothetical protein